jgi:tripartite-type tricarboxylate transporter receptor subunit TctC
MSRLASLLALGVLAGAMPGAPALSQSYPAKPIRLIVPGPPGSVTDVRARWLSEKLTPVLGQVVVVENRAGAGGNIGSEAAAKSAPDGYTMLLVHQGTLAINPHVYGSSLGYDPLADLAPITRLTLNPLLLAVHPSVPANSVADLIRLAKEKPGQLNYGSPGNGTPPHMAGELFKSMAGIDVTHVPYKGGAAALADLVAGRLTYSIEGMAIQLAQVKSGRLRALAVTGTQRTAAVPEVPTVAESGVPGYEYLAWTGVAVPAATPKPIIAKLHADIARTLRTPEAHAWLAASGAEAGGEPPEEFAAFIKAEYEKWGKVVREAGIKAE